MNWTSILLQIALVGGVIYWWIYQKQKDPNWKPAFMREKPEVKRTERMQQVREYDRAGGEGQTNIFIKVEK